MTLPNALFDAADLFVAAINGVWRWWSVGHFFWAAHTAFLKLDCKGLKLRAEIRMKHVLFVWLRLIGWCILGPEAVAEWVWGLGVKCVVGLGAVTMQNDAGCGRILSFRKGIRHLSYIGAEVDAAVRAFQLYSKLRMIEILEEEVAEITPDKAKIMEEKEI
ncbi:hypothetical protein Tco_0845731 [Tanacetum coccineum]